jgi:hypothetical protein
VVIPQYLVMLSNVPSVNVSQWLLFMLHRDHSSILGNVFFCMQLSFSCCCSVCAYQLACSALSPAACAVCVCHTHSTPIRITQSAHEYIHKQRTEHYNNYNNKPALRSHLGAFARVQHAYSAAVLATLISANCLQANSPFCM